MKVDGGKMANTPGNVKVEKSRLEIGDAEDYRNSQLRKRRNEPHTKQVL